MAIIIQHGTDMTGFGDAIASIGNARRAAEERKKRDDLQAAEQRRQEAADKRAQAQMEQSISESKQRMANAAEDQTWQEGERKRLTTARKDASSIQDARFQAIGGLNKYPVEGGAQGPEVQVPDKLPKELWPEYFRAQKTLEGISDPEAKAQYVQQLQKDWSAFSHLKGLDSTLEDMSMDLDSGAFQADSEGEPNGQEAETINALRDKIKTLADYRKQVAENPDKFDPSHVSELRDAYRAVKQRLAKIDATKLDRKDVISQLQEMQSKWTQSPTMRSQFNSLIARAGRADDPKELLQEAEKLTKEPDLYGNGENYQAAPPPVRMQFAREARQMASQAMASLPSDARPQSPQEAQQQMLAMIQGFEPTIARQHGWDTNPMAAGDTSGPGGLSGRFGQPTQDDGMGGASGGQPGAASPGGQNGGPALSLNLPRTPEEAAQEKDPDVRFQAAQAAQAQLVRARQSLASMPEGKDKDAALARLRAEAAKWLQLTGNDPNAKKPQPRKAAFAPAEGGGSPLQGFRMPGG